eukprot:TRINITY_DN7393_c0_g3_i1.p1 TRINITY_DN7393_c0_g3~~TRINITY_DN7393_c0_g3_i1.p1  ORF type:complete len:2514 (+),score=923.77 TRINITY_DN7393_c0_g3_i1:140-7681(+)
MDFLSGAMGYLLQPVVDKGLQFVVRRLLNRFLKSLKPEQFSNLELGREGVYALRKLELNCQEINEVFCAGLPFTMVYGRIGELDVSWTTKGNLSLTFRVKDVDLAFDFTPPVPRGPGGAPPASASASRHGVDTRREDILARSAFLGDISVSDINELRQDAKGVKGASPAASSTGTPPPEPEEDECSNALVKELLDKVIQRVTIAAENTNISVRFPSSTAGTVDVVRLELPWLEFKNKEMPATDKTRQTKADAAAAPSSSLPGSLHCKKEVTFQTLLVYLHQDKAEFNPYASTVYAASTNGTEATSRSYDPDLVLMVYAASKNSVEVTFVGNGAGGMDVKLFIESIHAVLGPGHLATVKRMAELLSGGSVPADLRSSAGEDPPAAEPAEHPDDGGDDEALGVTAKIMHVLVALVPSNAPIPQAIWDPLLAGVTESAERAHGQKRGGKQSVVKLSPVQRLEANHFLLQVSPSPEPSGRSNLVQLKRPCEGALQQLIVCLSVVELSWRCREPSLFPKNAERERFSSRGRDASAQRAAAEAVAHLVPPILRDDVSADPERHLIVRKLLTFKSIKNKTNEQLPQVLVIVQTSHTNTSADDVDVSYQMVRVRMHPKITVYAPLLKELTDACATLLAGGGKGGSSVPSASSVESLQSCNAQTYLGSPLSTKSFSDFEEAFKTDALPSYRRSPQPAGRSPPPQYAPPALGPGGAPPGPGMARSVTFGQSVMHDAGQDPPMPPPRGVRARAVDVPPLAPAKLAQQLPGSALDLCETPLSPLLTKPLKTQRDISLYGRLEAVVYFDYKEEVPLMGPYLSSVLAHHQQGEWLGVALRVKMDEWEARTQTNTITLPAAPAKGGSAPLQGDTDTSVWRMSTGSLKVSLRSSATEEAAPGAFPGGEEEVTLLTLEMPASERRAARDSTLAGGPRAENITITLRPTADPAAAARASRVPDMMPEEDEWRLKEAAAAAANVHVALNYPTAALALEKHTLLLLQYLIGEVVAAACPPETDFPPPQGPPHPSAGVPLSLLQTGAALTAWQSPTGTTVVTLECPKATIAFKAPMCFPVDSFQNGKPPYEVPYPALPPCHKYRMDVERLALGFVGHAAHDPWSRLMLECASVAVYDVTGAVPVPVLRNYHSLYQRSRSAVGDHGGHHSGLRVLWVSTQCTPANPAFAVIRDRQDMKVGVVFNRAILTHEVRQAANNWILVLAELFSDVELVDSLKDEDADDPPILSTQGMAAGGGASSSANPEAGAVADRLRATKIEVSGLNVIIDYTPVDHAARVLVFSERITFACLSVLLSEEFRAEVAVGPTTLLLDDGHFKQDLVQYDAEACETSLFGKSMGGMVCDLELLGFISAVDTTAGGDIKITIKSFTPAKGLTPHLKGRGVSTRKEATGEHDIVVEEEVERQKPFVVEVRGGTVRVECCTDSFKLLQDTSLHYLTAEPTHLRPVAEFYREALGLPPQEPSPRNADPAPVSPAAAPSPAAASATGLVEQAAAQVGRALVQDMALDALVDPSEEAAKHSGVMYQPVVVREAHYHPRNKGRDCLPTVGEDGEDAAVSPQCVAGRGEEESTPSLTPTQAQTSLHRDPQPQPEVEEAEEEEEVVAPTPSGLTFRTPQPAPLDSSEVDAAGVLSSRNLTAQASMMTVRSRGDGLGGIPTVESSMSLHSMQSYTGPGPGHSVYTQQMSMFSCAEMGDVQQSVQLRAKPESPPAGAVHLPFNPSQSTLGDLGEDAGQWRRGYPSTASLGVLASPLQSQQRALPDGDDASPARLRDERGGDEGEGEGQEWSPTPPPPPPPTGAAESDRSSPAAAAVEEAAAEDAAPVPCVDRKDTPPSEPEAPPEHDADTALGASATAPPPEQQERPDTPDSPAEEEAPAAADGAASSALTWQEPPAASCEAVGAREGSPESSPSGDELQPQDSFELVDRHHDTPTCVGGGALPPFHPPAAAPRQGVIYPPAQVPLSRVVVDDYFQKAEPQTSRLRSLEQKVKGALPELELIVSGVSWQLNLYGGKDFVTSMTPDGVNHKLKGLGPNANPKKSSQLYRTTRVYGQLVTVECADMFVLVDLFSAFGTADGELYHVKAGCRKLEVLDKLTVSSRNFFLRSLADIDETRDIIVVEVAATVPPAMAGTPEALKHTELDVAVYSEPLRVNVDQDALEFVARFFQPDAAAGVVAASPQAGPQPPRRAAPGPASPGVTATAGGEETPVHLVVDGAGGAAGETEGQVFFRSVSISAIQIKLDYNAKRCSLEGLQNLEALEFLNLINIEGMVIELSPVTVKGVWSDRLPLRLAEQWWEKLPSLSNLLSGVPTVRAVTRIGNAAAKVMTHPSAQYRQGKNPFSGLPSALMDFAQTCAVEAIHLTDQAARLGGGLVNAGVHALVPEDDDHPLVPADLQPATFQDGLVQALARANDDLSATVSVFGELPQAVRDGYVMLLARSFCLVLLRPVRGLFRGWCAVAQGGMISLDSERRAEHVVLFKPTPEQRSASAATRQRVPTAAAAAAPLHGALLPPRGSSSESL